MTTGSVFQIYSKSFMTEFTEFTARSEHLVSFIESLKDQHKINFCQTERKNKLVYWQNRTFHLSNLAMLVMLDSVIRCFSPADDPTEGREITDRAACGSAEGTGRCEENKQMTELLFFSNERIV